MTTPRFHKTLGTSEDTFKIGLSGAQLKRSGTTRMSVRDDDDASLANMEGASPVAAQDFSPKVYTDKIEEVSMTLGGCLAGQPLPLTGLGPEIIMNARTLTEFRALRARAGSAGTTTIQLEFNGTPTGPTLSWTGGTDPDNAQKSTSISLSVVAGDRVSFRVSSVEDGDPADVIVRLR